jgi:hypothetical protein
MRIKTGLTILIIFTLVQASLGQRSVPKNIPAFDNQKFRFGYSIGVNWMSFTMDETYRDTFQLDLQQHPGINVNLITSLRLRKFLDLRCTPGIQFSQRDIKVTRKDSIPEVWGAKIESVYFEMPFLLKYRAERVNNYAPFLVAGIAPKLDLTGGEIENWKPVKRLVSAFDVFPELGVGVDFYTQKVKVAMELKFSVGILNVFKDPGEDQEYDLYNSGVDRLMSKMVILSVQIQ